jgi:transposase
MSPAYLKGVQQILPQAAICHDRCRMPGLVGMDMDEVRAAEFKGRPKAVAQALGDLDQASRRSLSWAMRTHLRAWSKRHMQAMYTLQRTKLQSARD